MNYERIEREIERLDRWHNLPDLSESMRLLLDVAGALDTFFTTTTTDPMDEIENCRTALTALKEHCDE